MTTAEADYVKAKTSVWWDIENCEVPKIRDANTIVQNMISALSKMNYCGPVSIFAYGDTNLIPLPTLQALSSTGVRLNHVPAGVKDASDKKILVDMLLWAMDNPAPANIMLISGDRDFSHALHHLGMRQYNIILAQPPHASAPLVAAAKNVWLWTSLAAGGPPLPSGESSQLVNNIPCYVSNKEMSNHTIAEQAQSSKPTDSILDAGDTKDYRTRNKYVPKGLLQETRQNMLGNSSGTTGESFQLVNNGRCHASDYEVPKYPVSEQHQSSKPTYSTSYSGGSPQDKIRNISQNGEPITASRIGSVVSDSSVNFTKPLADKRNISQVAFVDSHKAQASVYEKPSKEIIEKHNRKKKAIEIKAKANSDFTCRMCNVVCHTQTLFDCHLRAKKHADMLTQSEALIDSKKFQEKSVGEKDQPREVYADSQLQSQENTKFLEKHVSTANQSKVLVDPKKLQQKGVEEKDQPKEITVQPKANAYHVCRLCNVVCMSQIDVDSHLRGQKHAAKLNQSKALTDSKKLQEEGVREKDQPRETNAEPPNALENSRRSKKHVVMVNESEVLVDPKKLQQKGVEEKDQPRGIHVQPKANANHVCRLCNVVCHTQTAFDSHLSGKKHANMLSQSEALTDSKKLQEKGVGEKDQRREIFAEPQLQSQMAQENTKFVEKHVSMVKQSKVLVDPVKLQQKGVEEKDQPREITVQPKANANHVCRLCDVVCQSQIVFDSHLRGQKHAAKLNQSKALTDSKKLQEEGVMEKDQPRETNAEPSNALENSKCSKKHVVMVTESEELIYARKLEEKEVRDKVQSVETIPKPPSQYQNTREHTEELRKICGASESIATFDRLLKSQNHSAKVTGQAEALVVDSRNIKEETEQVITEALKERHVISENLLHRVFTEQNRESRIPNEPRGCLDVIPERVKQPPNLSMAKKMEDESQHPGEASKKEEIKDQTVDNFWTRIWGKKG